VYRMTAQRTRAMYIRDVDNQAVAEPQRGRCRLGQKQRRLEVGADEIVPVDLGDVTERSWVEGGGVVDENVEAAEIAGRNAWQHLQLPEIEQIGFDRDRGAGPDLI